MFVQDRWTVDRLTVSGGVRIDWFFSENPVVPSRTVAADAEPQLRRAEVQHHALQGLDAEVRGGLRPVRRRPHGAQGQRRQVRARAGARHRRSGQPGRLQRAAHVVAVVDRQRRRLRPRLRPDAQHQPGPDGGRRRQSGRHLRRRGRRERELLQQLADPQPRGAGRRPLRLGQAAVQLGVRGQPAARAHAGPVDQRRHLLAPVRQLPGDGQHVRHGRRLRAVLGDARPDSRRAGVVGRRVAAERHLHRPVLQPEPRCGW